MPTVRAHHLHPHHAVHERQERAPAGGATRPPTSRDSFERVGAAAPASGEVIQNALSLPLDPRFQRLDPATQSEAMKRMQAFSDHDDPAARRNLTRLVTDAGFAQLSPEHQRKLLQAFDQAPRDPRLTADLRGLAGNAGFRALNSDTGSAILDRMATADPSARLNLMRMASSAGFGQLNPEHQAKLLGALDRDPANPVWAAELMSLSDSSSFRGLNDELKSKLIDRTAGLSGDPVGVDAYVQMATAPGFAALDDGEKDKLADYAGGHNSLSDPGRKALATLIGTPPTFSSDPPDVDAQAGALRGFLVGQPGAPNAATAPDGWFDEPGRRAPYSIATGKVDPDGTARYTVTVDGGKPIPVTVSPPTPPLVSPSIDEIAKGLAATPRANRELISEVRVSADLGPITPTGGHGYMDTNAATGVVTINATARPQGQTFTDSAFIHETGHVLSGQTFGLSTQDPGWDRWKAAMAKDVIAPSKYGQSTPAEDFSESLLLYQRVRGTPEEGEVRALMGERWAILAQLDP
jgi:hypothetical protein